MSTWAPEFAHSFSPAIAYASHQAQSLHPGTSFGAESGGDCFGEGNEDSKRRMGSDVSCVQDGGVCGVQGGSLQGGMPIGDSLEPAWMQWQSPRDGAGELFQAYVDELSDPGKGAVGCGGGGGWEANLGGGSRPNGAPASLGGGAPCAEGTDSIWQRICATREGGGADSLCGTAGDGSSEPALLRSNSMAAGKLPQILRFGPPNGIVRSQKRTLQRGVSLPPMSGQRSVPPSRAVRTPAPSIEHAEVNRAEPVSMDCDGQTASPWAFNAKTNTDPLYPDPLTLPPGGGLECQLAPSVRTLRTPLLRSSSDPKWASSYSSGGLVLEDVVAPPRPPSPRLPPLKRQSSVPADASPAPGRRLLRQLSAPEPDVAQLLGEQILLELQRAERGDPPPAKRGSGRPNLTPAQMQILLDKQQALIENPAFEEGYRSGLQSVRESAELEDWRQLSESGRQLAGEERQLSESGRQLAGTWEQRPQSDKRARLERRRTIENTWEVYARQREAMKKLAEARALLASIPGVAEKEGGHNIQPPEQSPTPQAPLIVPGGTQWVPLFPGRAGPHSGPGVNGTSAGFPWFEESRSSHPVYEKITVPELPKGSSPDLMPGIANCTFLVPVGPNLAHVMEIFNNAKPICVAKEETSECPPREDSIPRPIEEPEPKSPRAQLPSWEGLGFEEGLAGLEFSNPPIADTGWDSQGDIDYFAADGLKSPSHRSRSYLVGTPTCLTTEVKVDQSV